MLYQAKKMTQKARASSMLLNRAGKAGRYFSVLNWLSEDGLSLETYGREWLLVMPRSASKNATGLDVIEEPRSAWSVNVCGSTCCLAAVSPMKSCASSAVSRGQIIQPTT